MLAAIIISAVLRLFNFTLPIALWNNHRTEAVLLLATFTSTLLIGIVEGIVVGVLISIAVLVFKQMRPHYTILGRVKDKESVYRDTMRFPEAITREDVLIIRFDAPLHFANHRFLQTIIFDLLDARSKVKSLILCAESISYIDASGINSLEKLITDLESREIDFRLAAAIGPVRDVIKASDLISIIGKTKCFTSIKNAIEDIDNPGSNSNYSRKIAIQSEIE